MTNEEAIAKLEDVAKNMLWACGEYSEALEMAIKALEQEPCIQEKQANADKIDAVYIDGFKAGYSQARFDLEQQPCEDVISLTKEAYSDLCLRASKADDLQRALDMEKGAYNALVKNIQCDDAISRQAACDAIRKYKSIVSNPDAYDKAFDDGIDTAIAEIGHNVPPVTPQKYGKWIVQQEVNGDDYFKAYDISGVMTYAAKYKCDKCGFIQICIEDHGQYNYCPNCGCRMVEPQESEE